MMKAPEEEAERVSYINPNISKHDSHQPACDEVGALAACVSQGCISAHIKRDLDVSIVGGSVAVREPAQTILERMFKDGLLRSEDGQHCLHNVSSQIWMTPLVVSKHGDALWEVYRSGGGDLDCAAFKAKLVEATVSSR